MKKNLLRIWIGALSVFLTLLLSSPSSSLGQTPSNIETGQQTKPQLAVPFDMSDFELVVKTYFLKYAKANDIIPVIKLYAMELSGTDNIITIRISRKALPELEELIKKLDVERKNILFRLFIVHARKESPTTNIQKTLENTASEAENTELKKVLEEVGGLWNFKYYSVESPFFLTARDGSGLNSCHFTSSSIYDMDIQSPRIIGDEPGKRIVSFGQIKLQQTANFVTNTVINTSDARLKEKGYLVVGVSGFSSSRQDQALILVLSAEIK